MSVAVILAALLLGLIAGVFGGLAGIGGSIIMLPGLHLILGSEPSSVHHLYMATAMTVNFAVAVPSALGHAKAGAVRKDLLPVLFTTAAISIILGVLASNTFKGDGLRTLLAAFIALFAVWNIVRAIRKTPDFTAEHERGSLPMLAMTSGATGLMSGLLGLGGGVLLVPLLQAVNRIPLRNAIATSSAVICMSAPIGAGLKLATLNDHGQSVPRALLIAACMAPTAIIGARIGARLTHSLPLVWVRTAIAILLVVAAWRMVA